MNTINLLEPDQILSGIQLFDLSGFLVLLARFTLNMLVILILVRWLYYSATKRKDYLFTYILISSIIFLLCYLLANVKIQIGFALGLFAIFGIIRYRTSSIPIKEMTYLFLIIGVSIINSLADTKASVADILFTNFAIIVITFCMEKIWLRKREISKIINYEKIELIKPENISYLIKDLEDRTGITKINRVEIGKIDFLRDTCRLQIFYNVAGNELNNFTNGEPKLNDDDDD